MGGKERYSSYAQAVAAVQRRNECITLGVPLALETFVKVAMPVRSGERDICFSLRRLTHDKMQVQTTTFALLNHMIITMPKNIPAYDDLVRRCAENIPNMNPGYLDKYMVHRQKAIPAGANIFVAPHFLVEGQWVT